MLDSWHEIVFMLITLITLALQSYVACMIVWHTPKNMRDYTYFLVLLTLCDIGFTLIVGIALQPYPLPFLAVQGKGFCSYFAERLCVVSGSGALALGAMAILIQIYCLMYRCCALFRTKWVYSFFISIPIKCLCVVIGWAISIAVGFFFYMANYRRDEVPMHPVVAREFNILRRMLKPTDALLFIDLYDQYVINYVSILGGLLMLAESLSLLMVAGILLYLRKNSALFSRVTYRLHMQFTILLAVQLFNPLLLIIGPAAIYVSSLITYQELSETCIAVGFLVLSMYGFANGISTLVFVGPYRRRAKQQLVDPFLKMLGLWKRIYVAPDRPHSTVRTEGLSAVSYIK